MSYKHYLDIMNLFINQKLMFLIRFFCWSNRSVKKIVFIWKNIVIVFLINIMLKYFNVECLKK